MDYSRNVQRGSIWVALDTECHGHIGFDCWRHLGSQEKKICRNSCKIVRQSVVLHWAKCHRLHDMGRTWLLRVGLQID